MRLIESAKSLIALYKDYRTMDKDERADFYQSKCDYYQKYVELTLVACSFVSVGFLFFDYLINGTILPTLIPRLSIVFFLVAYIFAIHFFRERSAIVFMDYMVGHSYMLITIWSIYYLSTNEYSAEGIMMLNLIWMVIGFVSKPREVLLSTLVFFAEILISHSFIHYQNLEIIIALVFPSAIGVVLSHCLLMLYYLDHYRIRQKLELAMVTDPLTQVYNRHLLEKIVSRNTLKDVAQGEPIAVAMLDIDYFKKINDENGHYTGDLTLLYIGQKLSNETHDNDYVIRYGGEEFVIIFRNCDVNNACARMEQFRIDIENAKDTPVPFTISVGVSRYNGDYSKTIQNVDTALYKAKNAGRNRVVVV